MVRLTHVLLSQMTGVLVCAHLSASLPAPRVTSNKAAGKTVCHLTCNEMCRARTKVSGT